MTVFVSARYHWPKGSLCRLGPPAIWPKLSEYFDFVKINYIEKWPGNSPDLNPIENLWAIFKRELRERDTSTIAKLEAAIYNVWDTIDRKMLRKLAMSLPKRLKEVVRRKGYPLKY